MTTEHSAPGGGPPGAGPPGDVDTAGLPRKGRHSGTAPRRSRRALMGVVATATLFSAAGVGAGMWIKSPAQRAADAAAPEESVLTRPVEKRVLTSDVVTRGRVVAGQTVTIAPQAGPGAEGGAPVVSRLPKKAGEAIRPGEVLVEISGRPVFALEGRVPAYRDLKPGARGQDVRQLQTALRKLGFATGSDERDVFGAGTKKALRDFYASIGYEPSPATDDDGAAAEAAAATALTASRAVEDAQTALSDAYYALGKIPEGTDRTEAANAVKAARRTLERAIDDRRTARAALAEARAADGPKLPASEVVYLNGFPARVDSVGARVGSPVGDSVMTVSAGALVVHAYVNALQVKLLKDGRPAEIYAELDRKKTAARLVSVATTPTTARRDEGGEEQQQQQPAGGEGYLVVLHPGTPLAANLSGQDVRVTVQAASTGAAELVVPVTAVTAGRQGTLHVTVVAPEGRQRRVGVRELAGGGGYVAVAPLEAGALNPGDQVVTGVTTREPAAGSGTPEGEVNPS
ncbi:peptidoglycan-binding protein [Streptomyces sp. NPDC094448]|uniref:peptidoglycan-binding protein n=1 Tax=Streptomyces sp. NPDC094448 TaxID=3366063 RepID=UPI0038173893